MRGAAVAALAACLASCSGSDITDNTGDTIPENRGTLVQTDGAAVAYLSELAWSADGSELYFEVTASGQGRLMASPLSGGSPRILDGPRDAYIGLSASPDGSSLYFSADLSAGHRTTYRVPLPSGTAQVIAPSTTPLLPVVRGDGMMALPTRDGLNVAVAALPDSVLLVNVQSGARIALGNGCQRVVVFSPDSAHLICFSGTPGAGAYYDVDIGARTLKSIAILPSQQGSIEQVQWTPDGLQVLYQNAVGLGIWNFTTQQGGTVWPITQTQILILDRADTDWMPNGNRIAFWVHECLKLQGISHCIAGQSLLHILEPKTGRIGVVAVTHGEQPAESLALSPTGDRVAYIFDGKVYFQSTAIN